MEPSDVNAPSDDDAQLTALLRNVAPPLRDEGFSSRVLAVLPPSRPAWYLTRRTVVLIAGTTAGLGFAILQGLSPSDVQSEIAHVTGAFASVNSHFSSAHVWIAVATALGSLVVAFRSELRDKLVS
jgi:hypothetical protein